MFKRLRHCVVNALMPSVKSLSIIYASGDILFTIDRQRNCEKIPRTSKNPSINVRCLRTINFLNYLLTGCTEIVYKTRKMIHLQVKNINTANGGISCHAKGNYKSLNKHVLKLFDTLFKSIICYKITAIWYITLNYLCIFVYFI